MYYIKASSLISVQNSFQNKNWSEEIIPVEDINNYPTIEYSQFLPPASLRRLSPILKNALCAAISCKNETEEDFDSIIVGTSLGCLQDTEKFLQNIHSSLKSNVSVSPTAFIQSTHNTIGGQISLFLKNHSYNMTHTQNSLSLENALIDAMLCVNENKKNVLVGSADETIPFLDELDTVISHSNLPFTYSAGFICLGPKEDSRYKAKLIDVKTHHDKNNVSSCLNDFLTKNDLKIEEIDLLLHSSKHLEDEKIIESFNHSLCYSNFSGFHYSNALFALHLAINKIELNSNIKSVLIYNHLLNNSFALTLLKQ
ncbi:MAG: beta-ketoacyl synthase chain length factor [Flavobacteriia bacterium]|nr:beta-ketoacyl synthase chain length factor [Flavobacteriia bacterium]